MNKNGPVIIIEDNEGDKVLLQNIFEELNFVNEVIYFRDGEDVLEYLNSSIGKKIIPFIILSDINLPKLNGYELRDKIKMDHNLQLKCIPYLFFTTAATQKAVIDAYSESVQGFVVKPSSLSELKISIRVIMEYWMRCESPKVFMEE